MSGCGWLSKPSNKSAEVVQMSFWEVIQYVFQRCPVVLVTLAKATHSQIYIDGAWRVVSHTN